jgi:hypothetical protein
MTDAFFNQRVSNRTITALVVGIILGLISSLLWRPAGYISLLCSFVFPPIVYGIAGRRAIWVSIVPNVLLALTIVITTWRNYGPFPWGETISCTAFATLFSLLLSTPSYLIRNQTKTVKRVPWEKDS